MNQTIIRFVIVKKNHLFKNLPLGWSKNGCL